ncbi:peptidoglycan DD-metalloendopeptidase family protein [Thalassospira alkalitolerans]|uniref:peptidoglycan DD-metalloendopeptidase family protein n=1 Tax=Thalassospira alkalitolerans TaxID=1293890 RepID=UPI0030EC91F8|tara:strand:- start:60878 stop:62203 length:1326 start_codon:yes stop_codon:yes gene_type:complete
MSAFERGRRFVEKWFPDRQVLVRSNDSVSQLRLGKYAQLTLALIGILSITWSVGVTGYSWYLDQRLTAREEQLFRSELSYNQLIARVTESQRRFGEITSQMEGTHRNLLSMAEKNLQLQARVQDYTSKLAVSEQEKVRIFALRTSMDNQMNALQTQIDGITNRNLALRDELETVETVMSRVMRERDQAMQRSKKLQSELGEVRQRIADLHTVQKQAMQRVAETADTTILELESVLEMTGLQVGDIITPPMKPEIPGVGGPFVAFEPEHPEDEQFLNVALAVGDRMNQLVSLHDRIKRTPLGEPAASYYVSSLFGKRKDPINGKWAFHSGVDLAGPMKTPIQATAPGKVVFAGWSGKYGKMIEIDHGDGLRTRFGHLYKVLVKKGDEVNYQSKIALMGSTGRSTGSHVHYEVLVHDKQVDPIKFIEAGHYVFKNEQEADGSN